MVRRRINKSMGERVGEQWTYPELFHGLVSMELGPLFANSCTHGVINAPVLVRLSCF
jgi:hypothetical protein